jgi:hypothetical protein
MAEIDWHKFFKSQRGGMPGFIGYRYQRGHLGNGIFSGLFKSVLPILRRVGKSVGKTALKTGADVASDLLDGSDISESIERRGKEGAAKLIKKGRKGMFGKRRKYRQFGSGISLSLGGRRKRSKDIFD